MIYKEEAYKIIGAAMEVHNSLGNGFLEAVYQEALEREFVIQGISYSREQRISIEYKGEKLSKYYIADFVCYDNIIIELKALSSIDSNHEAQILNYLKATNYKLGLLINFGTRSLQSKRLVNEYNFKK